MHPTVGKILVLGIPLVLSLAWFAFWIIKLMRYAKKLKDRGPKPPQPGTGTTPAS